MPIGKGNVLIGMSEHLAPGDQRSRSELFDKRRRHVIIAAMPKLRAAMHLGASSPSPTGTVSCSIRTSWTTSRAFSYRPSDEAQRRRPAQGEKPFVDVVAEALGLKKMRVVETGGGAYVRADAVG